MSVAASDEPRYARALALDAERRGDEAAVLLRELLAEQPAHVDALALLGTIEAQAGRHDPALALLLRAAALRPASGAIHNNLGRVLEHLGHGEAALACYQHSLQLRPDHARTVHNTARLLRKLGREHDAIAAFERVTQLEPDDAEAWTSHAGLRAEVALRSGSAEDVAAAVAAYRAALAHGADDAVVAHALAALGAAPVPPHTPQRYVRNLFDRYAERFDLHLREGLEYRGPELVVGALIDAGPPGGADVVDLGCGTGLCGPLLRPLARRLVGVDLSAGMLARALPRQCYDRLEHGDLVEYLLAQPQAYDLAVSSDVLNYLGDLTPFIDAVHGALRPGGLLAVSLELHEGEGYVLRTSRRYAHAAGYLGALAAARGFETVSISRGVLRLEHGEPLEGSIVVLRRGA